MEETSRGHLLHDHVPRQGPLCLHFLADLSSPVSNHSTLRGAGISSGFLSLFKGVLGCEQSPSTAGQRDSRFPFRVLLRSSVLGGWQKCPWAAEGDSQPPWIRSRRLKKMVKVCRDPCQIQRASWVFVTVLVEGSEKQSWCCRSEMASLSSSFVLCWGFGS